MVTHSLSLNSSLWQCYEKRCIWKTLTDLSKHFHKKINEPPCTICYTLKIANFPKCSTVDTTNLQPVELIHMDFALYNVTSILGFTSIISVVCENKIMLWLFPTSSKIYPVKIIWFVLTTFNNEQHPWRHVRFYEGGALEILIDVTNLLVDDFGISIKNTGGDASSINGNY